MASRPHNAFGGREDRVVDSLYESGRPDLPLPNGTQWAPVDPSALTSAPPAAGDPFGSSSATSGKHVVEYNGTDGHIHQLYVNGGNWAQADLTALTNAPLSGGASLEYVQGVSQIVPFRGADSDIHQFTINNNSKWVEEDLNALAGAPASAGDPSAYIFDNQVAVYRGTDGHIHLLYLQ